MLPENKYKLYTTDSEFILEFKSIGPKGEIKKYIYFSPTDVENIYSLSFGDVGFESNEIDDTTRSDNKDVKKILITVANAVAIFLDKNPDAWVAATGSTDSRTRLYQIAISSDLENIETEYFVYGFNGMKWEKFMKNKNYEAFLIKKK